MPSRLEQLTRIIKEANDGLITTTVAKQLFEALMKFVRDAKAEMSQNMASHKAEMETGVKNNLAEIGKIEQKLDTKIVKTDSNLRSELRTVTRMFEQNVNDLRDEIPDETDLTPLQEEFNTRLAEIEEKIPELPKEKDVEGMIAELKEWAEEEHKKLEQTLSRVASSRGGGGVSAMGVRQAFKYIFHTEALQGTIDGNNTVFTVSGADIWAVVGITLNGESIPELPNFTFVNKTVTFSSAIPSSFVGKDFEIKFIG